MDHYYLSVYPRLQEMHPIKEHPAHSEKVSSMYVHLPFCSRICDFCSYFVKGVGNDKKQIDSYFRLLTQEFDNHQRDTNFSLDYIYFGGGTPSLVPPKTLDAFLGHLQDKGALSDRVLGTVELHPEFFKNSANAQDFFNVMKEHGIRRVSIGYQSSNDGVLEDTNRGHDAGFLQEAVRLICENGFRFNIDLMYGLSGLTAIDWAKSLKDSLAMSSDSISSYFLFVNKRTGMRRDVEEKKIVLPSHREIQIQHIMAQIALEKQGYFELPNDFFTRPTPEFDSSTIVQEKLPSATESLSIGAGSYGFSNRVQYYNQFDLNQYALAVKEGRSTVWMGYQMDDEVLLRRDLMFSFKNAPHINRRLFTERYQKDPVDVFATEMDKLNKLGLVSISTEKVSLTQKGRLIVEEIACQFKDPRVSHTFKKGKNISLLERHSFSPEYRKIDK